MVAMTATTAWVLFGKHKITARLIPEDANQPINILHMHDLLRVHVI